MGDDRERLPMTDQAGEMIVTGRVSGLFGVRGAMKVFSYTEPREGIVNYNPWYLRVQGQWKAFEVVEGHRQGKGVVARLEGIEDRDQAAGLIGADIAIRRDQLPPLDEGEYYWSDLEGLEVVTVDGQVLGLVDHLIETGANDVLVVWGERERLIPYLRPDVVVEVDLDAGKLRVDWDPNF
jgi:16S rRNA processing protein RimM